MGKLNSATAILLSWCLLFSNSPTAWAQVAAAGNAGGAVRGAPVAPVPAHLGRQITGFSNPAANGGIFNSGLTGIGAPLPSITAPAASVALSPNLTLPNAAVAAVGAGIASPAAVPGRILPGVSPAKAPVKTSILGSVSKFAASIAPGKSGKASGASVAGRSGTFFDGIRSRAAGMSDAPVPGGENAAGNSGLRTAREAAKSEGARSRMPPGVTFQALEDGSDIATFKPKMLFLADIFDKPASDRTVGRLQKLLDDGTRVVFMTWRTLDGKYSAENILLSRLKVKADNPVTVVSANGARIAKYVTGKKAETAASGVEFVAEELAAFAAINARAASALSLKSPLQIMETTDNDHKGTYMVRLAGTLSGAKLSKQRSALLRKYNGALRSSGLPYRMEAHPDDPRAIIAYAQPLRFALAKLGSVLDAQFPEEGLSSRGDESLLIADTKRWNALPGLFRDKDQFVNNAEIQHVADEAGLSEILGAVTGETEAGVSDLNFYKLRQYEDFWLPGEIYRKTGVRTTPKRGRAGSAVDQKFALYSAKILRKLIATLYDRSFRGKTVSLKDLEARLEAMWNNPSENGVWVDPGLKRSMKTAGWAKASNGHFLAARSYLRGIWFREFGDYALGANQVLDNLISLGSDRASAVSVKLRSPYSGKVYKMSVAPQRVMKLDSADGRILTAYDIRTGKARTPGPGDELQAKILALATLIGYGRKGTDFLWHHGTPLGKPISKIQVQFEYMRSHKSWTFSPEELFRILEDGRLMQGPVADQVVRLIERQQADHAYERDYQAKNKPRKGTAPAAQPSDRSALRSVQAYFGKDASAQAAESKPFKSDLRNAKREAPVLIRRQRTLKEGKKSTGKVSQDGSDLSTSHPRVVVILDIFKSPVSDTMAAYVQKLVDAGVRVVFMTHRPQKGPDSADSILLDRVKVGRANPVIVVSHNGGRVAAHSRAKNPAALVSDTKSFGAADIAAFGELAKAVGEGLGIEGIEAEALPDAKSAFSYSLTLPESAAASQRKAVMAAYNAALKEAGYAYRMDADPENARRITMYTMPLRFSIGRVYEALELLFKGENLPSIPSKWLILADSQRSPKFSKAFPKDAEVQVVRSAEGAEATLGAVLGDRRLETVSLKLGKLRQFVEYWEPRRERMGGKSPSTAGGGGTASTSQEWAMDKVFAKYTGSVFYKMMPWLFEQIWRGQHNKATLSQVENQLWQLWYHPMKNQVFISKAEAALMTTPAGKKARKEYFKYARAFLRNLWLREFSEYSDAALDIMENLVSLSSDRQSLITLMFKSKTTGKLYKIFTRVPVLMKHDTPNGRVLTAHAYRTGKERPDDGDELHAKILAMATLVAYGHKGADGLWHHGWFFGPKISKIHIRLEYRTAPRDMWFDPNELLELQDNGKVSQGDVVQEILSAIERMEADPEYQEYWKEQQKQATDDDMKTEKQKARKAKTPAKAGKGGKR